MRTKKLLAALGAGSVLSLATAWAPAGTVDLRTVGASGSINGAMFVQNSGSSAGTGVFGTFLRIEAAPQEQGYNSDWRPVEFDEKSDPHSHSLLVGNLPTVVIGNVLYRQFVLDSNEAGGNKNDISLDKLQIFETNDPNAHGYMA